MGTPFAGEFNHILCLVISVRQSSALVESTSGEDTALRGTQHILSEQSSYVCAGRMNVDLHSRLIVETVRHRSIKTCDPV